MCEPGFEAGLAPGVYSYLRDSATGSFRLLGPGVARFADAAAGDSRIVFESSEQLLPDAAPGVVNLYEWDGSKPPGKELSLAGILPDGKALTEGSLAGPGGPALGEEVIGGATGKFYTQDTISEDGSRIFFSDAGTGRIYMREPEAERTIPVSAGPAYWRAATADGSYVFYTEGEDLYRFNVAAQVQEPLTSGAAGVLGTLGIATESGAYAYFVATGVLADNENDNKEKAEAGKANLYEWHAGKTLFIARLDTEGLDPADWRGFFNRGEFQGSAQGEKTSRVTPSGATVLFASQAQLTSYDNAENDELYLYEAPDAKLICVSCNPYGKPATSETYLTNNGELGREPGARAFLMRNLSEDGSRVFFQTQEALVPQDKNGQTDVYEWEREGAGFLRTRRRELQRKQRRLPLPDLHGRKRRAVLLRRRERQRRRRVLLHAPVARGSGSGRELRHLRRAHRRWHRRSESSVTGELQRRRMSRSGRFCTGVQRAVKRRNHER